MAGFFTGALIGLLKHVEDLQKIKDIKKNMVDPDMLFSILLNLATSWGGLIGFGRPYMPAMVYTTGLLIAVLLMKIAAGLFMWIERLVAIFSLLSLVGEYFYYFFSDRERTDRKKKIKVFLCIVLFYSVLFFIILSHWDRFKM